MRNVLTKVVGVAEDLEVSPHERLLTEGETLLLCTDGVHGLVDDEAIRQILSGASIEDAAGELVQRALDRGGSDNATAVLVRYAPSGSEAGGARP
jgi:protein phosphatase